MLNCYVFIEKEREENFTISSRFVLLIVLQMSIDSIY